MEQLLDRTSYLGASDAPAALGLSKWRTPLQVWLEKTGQIVPQEQTMVMRLGNFLEPLVLQLFEERTGKTVGHRQMELISGSEPWRRAHLDGMTEDHELVEAKTAGMIFLNPGPEWGEEGTDEIPDPYIVQVMHQFSLMPAAQICWLPVLIRGDFRIYRVERKDDLIEMILEKEREFWHKVENLERPEAKTSQDLNLLFPQHMDKAVEANQEIVEVISDFKRTKGVIKDLEARIETLSFQIKSYLGEAESVYTGPTKLATWKAQTNNRLDMDRFKAEEPELYKKYLTTSTTRVLRMLKGA